ncbi:MAG: DUF1289 domain-containing protein [Rhodocyclaceae bacterium]|nr:DUF1289 domain-containing protein [Rhodocyclaceae bacterium]
MSIASPCVNICRMDAATSADDALCAGCYRTLDEIAQWSRASDDAKLAILAAVGRRRAGRGPAARDAIHEAAAGERQ